jgi:hypothetical protein
MNLLKYIILFSFIGIAFSAQSQNVESLRLKSNFFGNKFYKGDSLISVNQVLYEMAPNESVYNLMLSAKKDFVFAQILGATGGVLVGWPLGTAVAGGDPNWTLAGIGVGIIAISIPISINFKNKALGAIAAHNKLMSGSNRWNHRPTYHLGFDGRSLKVQFRF